MESETFITVYLDNSIVSVKRTAAIPERVMLITHGTASIFGRMMARGVLLAYGPARARLWMSKWSLKRLSLFTSTIALSL